MFFFGFSNSHVKEKIYIYIKNKKKGPLENKKHAAWRTTKKLGKMSHAYNLRSRNKNVIIAPQPKSTPRKSSKRVSKSSLKGKKSAKKPVEKSFATKKFNNTPKKGTQTSKPKQVAKFVDNPEIITVPKNQPPIIKQPVANTQPRHIFKMNVVGPVSLTEFKTEQYGGYHIYVFGDFHASEVECQDTSASRPLLQDFVENTINLNKDKMIDVFVESDFQEQGHEALEYESSYLEDFKDHFKYCLVRDKYQCKFKNARFHYADLRKTVKSPIRNLAQSILTAERLGDTNKMNEIIAQSQANYDELKNVKFDDFLLVPKINKQFIHINHVELQTKIKIFFEARFNKFLNRALQLLSNVSRNGQANDPRMPELWSNLAVCGALIMDMYLIMRLFRSFVTGKNPTAQYSIIYAGNVHANTYRDLFDYLGFVKIAEETSSEKGKSFQCLPLVKFKRPFFS